MGFFSLRMRRGDDSCGHQSAHPFRAKCTRPKSHKGQHSARGMRWGEKGEIKFGSRTRKPGGQASGGQR